MVFAKCKEGNRSFYHLADATVGLTATFGAKHSEQLWIAIVALGCIEECLNESPRGIFCSSCFQVHSKGRKDFCGISFEFAKLLIRGFAHLQFHSCTILDIIRVVMYVHRVS